MRKKGSSTTKILITLLIIGGLAFLWLNIYYMRITFGASSQGRSGEIDYEVGLSVKLAGENIRNAVDKTKFEDGIRLLEKENEVKVRQLIVESKK